jgi:hypothetical protein
MRRRQVCILVLLAGVAVAHCASAQVALPNEQSSGCPQDTGAESESFSTFRRGLLDAVRRRDRSAVLAAVAPDVGVGTQGRSGASAFDITHDLSDARSEFWPQMEDILLWGATRTSQAIFCAPSIRCSPPPDVLEHYEDYVVVVGDGAKAIEPATGREVAVQRCALLRAAGSDLPQIPEDIGAGFTPLFSPPHGWVSIENRFVRSLPGLRVHFVQKGVRWYIAAIFGDD